MFHWWDIFWAAMRAQSLNALGQAFLLVGKEQVLRLDAPESPRPIPLDDYVRARDELPAMARSLVEASGADVFKRFLSTETEAYQACPLQQ
jgi:uncharacterized protein